VCGNLIAKGEIASVPSPAYRRQAMTIRKSGYGRKQILDNLIGDDHLYIEELD
jgi:hypothetical protein